MASEKYKQLRKKDVPDLHNVELLKACKEDNDLLAEFLINNKEFIFSIISSYKGSIESLKAKFNVTEEEILQHGYIGMITALRDFDFDKGVKFTTFAARPIIWEINHLLYNSTKIVRLSRSAVELIKEMEQIENELGYFPPPEELAKIIGYPKERIEEVLRFATDIYYLGEKENDIEDINLSYEKEITDKVYVENLINNSGLNDFEKKVARLIMEGLNNSQIANKLGVYPMTINRTIERIRSKMEKTFTDKRPFKYEEEIEIIVDEMNELGRPLHIEEIKELLDVCGFDVPQYTTRILYYIRQKAIKEYYKINDKTILQQNPGDNDIENKELLKKGAQ